MNDRPADASYGIHLLCFGAGPSVGLIDLGPIHLPHLSDVAIQAVVNQRSMGISIVIDAAIRIQLTFREIGSPNQGYTGLLLLSPVGANPDALPRQDLVHRDRTLSIPPLGLSSFKECLGQLRNKDSKIWIRQLRCLSNSTGDSVVYIYFHPPKKL